MGVVLDTSVIIELERRDATPASIATLIGLQDDLHLAAITISELLVGALLAEPASRQRRRTDFLETVIPGFAILPFGEREARQHAELYVALRRAGTPVGERDLLIAATAMANGHAVMIRNEREFGRIDGLNVVAFPGPEA